MEVTLLSLSVIPAEDVISIGETTQFNALGSFSNDSTTDVTATVTWTISDTTIATVSSGGLATGVAGGTVTITATDDETGQSATATLTVVGAEQLRSEEQTAILGRTVDATQQERDAFGGVVAAILGEGVEITGAAITVSNTDAGLIIELPATGLTGGQEITGDLNTALGNLTLETTDGQGTATIGLGVGLSVKGSALLAVTDQGIDVIIENPQLTFQPTAPDATLLEGGSESVTEIGVDFQVELDNLPDDASLSVQFAKAPSAFQESPGATFQLAAQEAGGTIEDETEDIAFSINVVRSGITNQGLGSNTVTLTVSKSWYDQKVAEDKFIVITKIDDEGNVFTVPTTCVVSGDVVRCTADFTGSAGGLLYFYPAGRRSRSPGHGHADSDAAYLQPGVAATYTHAYPGIADAYARTGNGVAEPNAVAFINCRASPNADGHARATPNDTSGG